MARRGLLGSVAPAGTLLSDLPRRPNRFLSLLTGISEPGLDPDQERLIQRMALVRGGLATLAASAPQASGIAPSLGQVLAAGIGGGQQAGEELRARALEQQQLQRAQQNQQVLAQMIQATPPAQLPALVPQLLASGNVQAAQTLISYLNSIKEGAAPRPIEVKVGDETHLVDPVTQQTLRVIGPSAAQVARTEGRATAERAKEINTLVNELRDDIRPVLTPFNEMAQQVARARVAGSNAIGDQTRIATYSRLIDPLGSVREGDVARIGGAGGLPALAQRYFNLLKDGRLPADVRAQIDAEIQTLGREMQAQLQPVLEDFRDQARSAGIPDERLDALLRDPFARALAGRRPRTLLDAPAPSPSPDNVLLPYLRRR